MGEGDELLLHLIVALNFVYPPLSPKDTARIEDGRLIIEPLGSSFVVPPIWLEAPNSPRVKRKTCDAHSELRSRIYITRESLLRLPNAIGEWDKEFSSVVDSVLPFLGIVAQLGAEGWGAEAQCSSDLQVRIYVTGFELDRIGSRAKTIGKETAGRFFPSAKVEEADTVGWRLQRVQWDAWYYDYGGPAYVEFLSRRIRGRTLTLVFMYSGGFEGPVSDRAIILQSFREGS
jgi:hypothetical protein